MCFFLFLFVTWNISNNTCKSGGKKYPWDLLIIAPVYSAIIIFFSCAPPNLIKMNQWTSTESQDTRKCSIRLPSSNAHRWCLERDLRSPSRSYYVCRGRRRTDGRTDSLQLPQWTVKVINVQHGTTNCITLGDRQAVVRRPSPERHRKILWICDESFHPAPRRRPSHTRPTAPNPLSFELTSGKSFGAPPPITMPSPLATRSFKTFHVSSMTSK